MIIKYWKDYHKWNLEQFLSKPEVFPDRNVFLDPESDKYVIEYKIYINEQPLGLPIDHVSTIIDSFSFWSDQKFDTTDGKTATINFTTTPLKGEANVWITWVVRNLGEGVLGHANLGKGVVEVAIGGYGGGREGVMQAEYQTQSDRNRAALQAQLQAQGFSQAQAARQADLQNQMMLSQGQLGLGQATSGLAQQQAQLGLNQLGLGQAQLGLGQYQLGTGQALQGFQGTDIARAGSVGAVNQAQAQAVLDAQREANRLAAYEPLERLGIYGQAVTGLMGGYPAQYQFQSQPGASPLAQALGIGSTLGGIYGNVMGPVRRS